MKSNLDDIMKKKYAEIETPKLESKLYYRKNNRSSTFRILKVAGVFVILVAFSIIFKVVNQNKSTINENANNILQEEIAKNVSNTQNLNTDEFLVEPSQTIVIGPSTDIVSIAQLKVEHVAIVKVNKILGYTNYSKLQNTYKVFPITKLEIEVEETLKGSISGTIEINKPGGIISLADYEKALTDIQKENQGYNKKK